MNRTGALAHIRRLTPRAGPGVWIADLSAEVLGVEPGDEIEFARPGQAEQPVRIAGIYKALSTYPLNDYWKPITHEILPTGEFQPVPDPFLIADRATFFEAGVGAFSNATIEWNFPLTASRFTLPEAASLSRRLSLIAARTRDPETRLGEPMLELQAYGNPSADTALTGAVERSQQSVAALKSPVDLLTLAGRAVALAVLAAAGLFAFQRRREEVRLLATQGMSPLAQGAKAALESLGPVLVGAGLAWLMSVELTRELGPTRLIDEGVAAVSLCNIAWSSAIALIVLGITFGLAARREATPERGGRSLLARAPWDVALLALAAASLYEVVTRQATATTSGSWVDTTSASR